MFPHLTLFSFSFPLGLENFPKLAEILAEDLKFQEVLVLLVSTVTGDSFLLMGWLHTFFVCWFEAAAIQVHVCVIEVVEMYSVGICMLI